MLTKERFFSLIEPQFDKGFSFQGINITEKDKINLIAKMNTDETVRKSNPFLQGCSENWIMIEFWCDYDIKIVYACKILFETVNFQFNINDKNF